jgi:hypothetical protein
MRRREFITLIGGAAVLWPLGTWAQQGERVRRIGVLLPATADDADFQSFYGAFLQVLQITRTIPIVFLRRKRSGWCGVRRQLVSAGR